MSIILSFDDFLSERATPQWAVPSLERMPKTRLYHGTSSPEFAAFDSKSRKESKGLIFLSDDEEGAMDFANTHNGWGFGKKGGPARVLYVDARPGLVWEITPMTSRTFDPMRHSEEQVRIARQNPKIRYLSFPHPGGSKGKFECVMSLYPDEDLTIVKEVGLRYDKAEGGMKKVTE